MKYDREEMRVAVQEISRRSAYTFDSYMESLLDEIEQTLGLHTPAPVRGEQISATVGSATKDNPVIFNTISEDCLLPQEKKCTCEDWPHFTDCPLYQQPLKEKVELPEETNVDGAWSTASQVLVLNKVIRYLRAQEDSQKDV